MSALTKSQKEALKWLTDRGGDAMFDKNGVVLAAGESAPFMRSTWNRLRETGHVTFYGGYMDGLTGHGRLKITR